MKNIAAKLLKVQQALKPIPKDLENPYFHSSYFDINAVLERLKPLLSEQGLLLLQPLTSLTGNLGEDGSAAILTLVIDPESGEEFAFTTPLMGHADVQKLGASITYQRRYALVSFFCLEAVDDDGETAMTRPKATAHAEPVYYAPEPSSDTPAQAEKHCATCGKWMPPHSKYTSCYNCNLAKKQNP